jgi:hypothetical protein
MNGWRALSRDMVTQKKNATIGKEFSCHKLSAAHIKASFSKKRDNGNIERKITS